MTASQHPTTSGRQLPSSNDIVKGAPPVDLQGQPLSADSELWAAVGKKFFEDSMMVGREYARFMIQYAFAAIPAYIALTTLARRTVVPAPNPIAGAALIVVLPAVLFLASGIFFVLAYYPKSSVMHSIAIEDIKRVHEEQLRRRLRWNLTGTVVFAGAIICALVVLVGLSII